MAAIKLDYYGDRLPPKRGRPFTQMGEFDLSLIREFRQRPEFYDRNCEGFKDKVYTARQWQEISHRLGYDVSLLKDRMLQLRNRYNLEKRRLDQLRDENPGKIINSQWPLFDKLHFLSDHIRSRRSYKRLLPNPVHAGNDMSSSHSSSNMDSFPNGLLAVKMEQDDDGDNEQGGVGPHGGDTDAESASAGDLNARFMPPTHSQMLAQATYQHSMNAAAAANAQLDGGGGGGITSGGIRIRRVHTLRQQAAPSPQRAPRITVRNLAMPPSDWRTNTEADQPPPAKQPCIAENAKDQKFASFCNFVYSSFLEMPEQKALSLVERFANEIVSTMLQKGANNDTTDSSSSSGEEVTVQ